MPSLDQRVLVLLVLSASLTTTSCTHIRANPIRKVLNMLQMMTRKVEADGKKEGELHDEFMCYCQKTSASLNANIEDAKTKIPELESSIQEASSKLDQLKTDINNGKTDIESAKTTVAEEGAMRQKEHAAYLKESSDFKADVTAMTKAIAALEAGTAAGFLQTNEAQVVRKVVASSQEMEETDREDILAFFSNSQADEYDSASSGEIVGILKQLKDEISKELADTEHSEASASKAYEDLMEAKKHEKVALKKMIEEKLQRVGDMGVEIEQMRDDQANTEASLAEDEKFIAELGKSCSTKDAEHKDKEQLRNEELVTLAQTIKLLNDDDARELFMKTLPASTSFLQVKATSSNARSQALSFLQRAKRSSRRVGVDLIALALRGKQAGFDEVVHMIDKLLNTLKLEQKDDDEKSDYCTKELEDFGDTKKELDRAISDEEKSIAKSKDSTESLTIEIRNLETSIEALDQAVEKATALRKDENDEFQKLLASCNAAKELLLFAKNRLNKFYNVRLYKAPPKQQLSEEDTIYSNFGGEVTTPPPGGIAGTGIFSGYQKSVEEASGVAAMLDLLIKDLAKQVTEAEVSEAEAQKDYESALKESRMKRAGDAKHLAAKQATVADVSQALEEQEAKQKSLKKQEAATVKYIESLRMDCDFLLKEFDVRKQARAAETDSLKQAKAVLSGGVGGKKHLSPVAVVGELGAEEIPEEPRYNVRTTLPPAAIGDRPMSVDRATAPPLEVDEPVLADRTSSSPLEEPGTLTPVEGEFQDTAGSSFGITAEEYENLSAEGHEIGSDA